MRSLRNDMDPTKLMDEVQSLHLKLNSITKMLGSLDKNVNNITKSQQIGGKTVRKSAGSMNFIIEFLVRLRKLSHEELKDTLVEADAILNIINPIATVQNLDQTHETHVTKDKLKPILKEVFDLLSSLPLSSNTNNPVASTSFESRRDNTKVKEEKIQFWRKYKNKYNYIEKLKLNLPPLKNSVVEVESLQNDVNGTEQNDANPIVQNDVNSTVQSDANPLVQNDVNGTAQNDGNGTAQNDGNGTAQNDGNGTAQNDANGTAQNDANPIVQNDVNDTAQSNVNDTAQNNVNGTAQNDVNGTAKNDRNDTAQNNSKGKTTYTIDDIIQNEEVYEMFKSRLKNSPYDDPFFKKNVKNTKLTLTLHNGETIVKPVSHVAPLIILEKCDDLCAKQLQNKKIMGKHFQSTSKNVSNKINDSNCNDTTEKRTKRETRSSKMNSITKCFDTHVKTAFEKRQLSIKTSDYEPSKKKKN